MRERLSGPWDFVTRNFKTLVVLGVAYFGGVQFGVIEPINGPALPDLPPWSELVGLGVMVAVLLGVLAGAKIYDLLPEPPHVLIVAITEDRDTVNEIWQISPDTYAEMDVEGGTLYQWPNTKVPTYEALTYDPEQNRAVATWRKAPAASEILGHKKVDVALEMITDLRAGYEEKARIGDLIQTRIGTIIRRKDYERARALNDAIRGHTLPTLGDEPTTDEVIRDVLGDLAPEHLNTEEAAEEIDGGDFDLMDVEPEALVPVEPDGGEPRER